MSGGNGGGPVTWGRRGWLSKSVYKRLGGWWMLQFSNARLGEKFYKNNIFFYILQWVDGWVGTMTA